MRVTVFGAGSWGTALALLLARNGHEVTLLARDAATAEQLNASRENARYLPGHPFPPGITCQAMETPRPRADLAVVALPSTAVRAALGPLEGETCVLVATKGWEPGRETGLAEVVAAAHPHAAVGVLSGPNLAREIAEGQPTVAVIACADPRAAECMRAAFMGSGFRIYLSDDVRGVELAGALKNVLALGVGILDGLGMGSNTKAALVARGLNEIARIGTAQGARLDTFLGVAGVGDLFATASSTLSRNQRVGRALGQGRTLAKALREVEQVAEGVPTCEAALLLAQRVGVEAPLTAMIHAILQGRIEPRAAVQALMERVPRREGVMAPARADQTPVALAFGSNVGDRIDHLRRGLAAVAQVVRIERVSSLYGSAPMYREDQDDFVNGALVGLTSLGPRRLLVELKRIEAEVGRQRRERNGPREIDLDIVALGSLVLRGDPCLPHPRTAERRFVLEPLAEIAPDLVLPGVGRVSELAARNEITAQRVERIGDAPFSL